VERFAKRWQRSDYALTSQHTLKNHYNDSLNRWMIHQIVERFVRHWQRFDYSLTSQYTLRNRCNDSLNRYTVHHIIIMLHKTLATF
jgi:hypothetical protein